MPALIQKRKTASLNGILAAAKKLTPQEKQVLKVTLFGNDIIAELKAFESSLKKRKTAAKKTDAEIAAAVKKIRTKNAAK